ncbi:hypothetical protein FRC18_000210 [Serendipita sp. 400]|nr:hypothetical protein FRC18_000210 [Serendipita sp. 400]
MPSQDKARQGSQVCKGLEIITIQCGLYPKCRARLRGRGSSTTTANSLENQDRVNRNKRDKKQEKALWADQNFLRTSRARGVPEKAHLSRIQTKGSPSISYIPFPSFPYPFPTSHSPFLQASTIMNVV